MPAAQEQRPLHVRAGQCTSAGRKPDNQDSCGIFMPDPPLLYAKGIAAVIADGVSAAVSGKEAAESCVTGFLNDYYSTPESWSVETSGAKVLAALNRWLCGQGYSRHGQARALVSTLSVLVLKAASAYLFHIGDTRIWRLRGGELECLTRDHKAFASGDKTYLARALGLEPDIEIDYRSVGVDLGDCFMLTTDGVHEFLDHHALRGLLVDHSDEDCEALAQRITAQALARGSPDNLTCQILRVERLPQAEPQDLYRQLAELPFPPPLTPGMSMDGYLILRELHASRRTQVYLALDTATAAQVVLKTPSVNFDDDARYISRFLHEEWVGRRIEDPHVVRCLEPQRTRQFLYYVTEHVEGQTLRQWLADHSRPSLERVRNIVEQLALGLRAFHRLEMTHQDLKPENILIDAHGTVKIVDFGSTRIAGVEEMTSPLAQTGLLGTRNYTAPEYLQGYAGGAYSDQFSLGVIAYELLTGKLPYGDGLTVRKLKRCTYTPAREHNPDVPAWMDAALARAVAIDPRARYQELTEFVQDLRTPNADFLLRALPPLLERNPLVFWRWVAALSLLVNLGLLLRWLWLDR